MLSILYFASIYGKMLLNDETKKALNRWVMIPSKYRPKKTNKQTNKQIKTQETMNQDGQAVYKKNIFYPSPTTEMVSST